jgi:predicted metal-binding protein
VGKRANRSSFDPETEGQCDFCDFVYDLASFEDHCTECGNCNQHCTCSPAKREAIRTEHERLAAGRN